MGKSKSSSNDTEFTGSMYVEECKQIHYLSPYTKLKSNRIKNLNIKPDTLILMGEKVGNNLEFIGKEEDFLSRI